MSVYVAQKIETLPKIAINCLLVSVSEEKSGTVGEDEDEGVEEREEAMIDNSMDSSDDHIGGNDISKIEKMNIALNSIWQRLHDEEEQRRYGYQIFNTIVFELGTFSNYRIIAPRGTSIKKAMTIGSSTDAFLYRMKPDLNSVSLLDEAVSTMKKANDRGARRAKTSRRTIFLPKGLSKYDFLPPFLLNILEVQPEDDMHEKLFNSSI
jgi:hypothetical protein